MEKIKVTLVDDHKLLRDSVDAMLSGVRDLQVVGSFSSGEELISHLKDVNTDVILMDIMLRGMSGIEATRWVKERNAKVKIILLSMDGKKEFLSAGIQSGIDGYLTKDVPFDVLLEAIRSVHRGKQYFNESITGLIFEEFCKHELDTSRHTPRQSIGDLTKRETEVFMLVVAGHTNKEIAAELKISAKTVDTHKTRIFDKLGVRNTAELVKYAIKNKLITV